MSKSCGILRPKHALAALVRLQRSLRVGFHRLLLRLALVFLPRAAGPPDPARIRQIAVFSDMGIGNFILFVPMLKALRVRFPAAEIVLVCCRNPNTRHVPLAPGLVDRTALLQTPATIGFPAYLSALRQCRAAGLRPDMTVNRFYPHFFPPVMTLLLRPRHRIGHVSSAGFSGYLDGLYNHPVAMREDSHEVDRYLDLARAAGATEGSRALDFPLGHNDRGAAEEYLRSQDLGRRPLIAMQPGASLKQSWKRWPLERWSLLIQRARAAGCDVLLLGSAEERKILDTLRTQDDLPGAPRLVNAAGQLSFAVSAAVAERARVLVCNDSSLMHVGAALNLPMVVLFGPTDYHRTRPLSDSCAVLRKPCTCNRETLFSLKAITRISACAKPCLDTSVDEAAAAIGRWLPLPAKRRQAGALPPCPVCGQDGGPVVFRLDLSKWKNDRESFLRRCPECGSLHVWPFPGPEELVRLYSEEYYVFRRTHEQSLHRAVLTYARTLLLVRDQLKDKRLLDVGCARGHFLALAVSLGWQGAGVELSEAAAEKARADFGLEVFTGALESFAQSGRRFPVVTAIDVLEHVDDPRGLLQTMAGVLEPGGILILDTPNAASQHIDAVGGTWRGFNPFHIVFCTCQGLQNMLLGLGFEIMHSFSYNNIFPTPPAPPATVRGVRQDSPPSAVLRRAAAMAEGMEPYADELDARLPLAKNRMGENIVLIARLAQHRPPPARQAC